jgi:hypothetical protein
MALAPSPVSAVACNRRPAAGRSRSLCFLIFLRGISLTDCDRVSDAGWRVARVRCQAMRAERSSKIFWKRWPAHAPCARPLGTFEYACACAGFMCMCISRMDMHMYMYAYMYMHMYAYGIMCVCIYPAWNYAYVYAWDVHIPHGIMYMICMCMCK